MSVEYCLLRLSPPAFAALQGQADLLEGWMDGFQAQPPQEKSYVDSREVIRAASAPTAPSLRMLYFDEFTTSLLVDFRDDSSAFFLALAGWGKAHILEEVRYGYGNPSYYSPPEVTRTAADLEAYPNTQLEARFQEQAEHFRIASAGYFPDDGAILGHQRTFADLLRKFYREAAQAQDFVLLLVV